MALTFSQIYWCLIFLDKSDSYFVVTYYWLIYGMNPFQTLSTCKAAKERPNPALLRLLLCSCCRWGKLGWRQPWRAVPVHREVWYHSKISLIRYMSCRLQLGLVAAALLLWLMGALLEASAQQRGHGLCSKGNCVLYALIYISMCDKRRTLFKSYYYSDSSLCPGRKAFSAHYWTEKLSTMLHTVYCLTYLFSCYKLVCCVLRFCTPSEHWRNQSNLFQLPESQIFKAIFQSTHQLVAQGCRVLSAIRTSKFGTI